MEVRINKEIRDYQESMFFGLSLRQCIFSLLAVAAAVGVYFAVHDAVGFDVGWICILAAAPFAACGFVRYHGLLPLWNLLWEFTSQEKGKKERRKVLTFAVKCVTILLYV